MTRDGKKKYIYIHFFPSYVMQSRGISQKLHMWHFQFSIYWTPYYNAREVHFAENHTWIGPVVLRLCFFNFVVKRFVHFLVIAFYKSCFIIYYYYWRILRIKENNSNSFLFLAISHNQCCRLPTDPARSQHILLRFLHFSFFFLIFFFFFPFLSSSSSEFQRGVPHWNF